MWRRCDVSPRERVACPHSNSLARLATRDAQPPPSSSDNITSSFSLLNVTFQSSGGPNGTLTNHTNSFAALGPTGTSVNATAPNGASMTLTAGSNVTLVIKAASGMQTCSITGGVFPYAFLYYYPDGPALFGCNSSACLNPTNFWYSSQYVGSASGCMTNAMMMGPFGAGSAPYCASTCGIVNYTFVGTNLSVFLASDGTWYNAGVNFQSGQPVSGVVFGNYSSMAPAVQQSPPPSPPSPLPPLPPFAPQPPYPPIGPIIPARPPGPNVATVRDYSHAFFNAQLLPQLGHSDSAYSHLRSLHPCPATTSLPALAQ